MIHFQILNTFKTITKITIQTIFTLNYDVDNVNTLEEINMSLCTIMLTRVFEDSRKLFLSSLFNQGVG